MDPKHKFLHHKIDVEITYTLLLGTIVHDVIATFVISASDWNIVTLKSMSEANGEGMWLTILFLMVLSFFLVILWGICYVVGVVMKALFFWFTPIMQRRWSGCISQYNLIFCCLHPRSKKWDKLIDNLGLTNILDGRKYVMTKRFNEVLRDFIFGELKIKSTEAVAVETAMEFCSTKGEWVLKREGGCDNLLPCTLHADYDKILISWHIATELCFRSGRESFDILKNFVASFPVRRPSPSY